MLPKLCLCASAGQAVLCQDHHDAILPHSDGTSRHRAFQGVTPSQLHTAVSICRYITLLAATVLFLLQSKII